MSAFERTLKQLLVSYRIVSWRGEKKISSATSSDMLLVYRERKCADTIGTVLVPCMGWSFPVLKYKYIFFQIKYTEAILSNSTRKLLWFDVTKMLIAVKKSIYCVIYYNFGHHTFVPRFEITRMPISV